MPDFLYTPLEILLRVEPGTSPEDAAAQAYEQVGETVEKAVAPHTAHYQARKRTGRFGAEHHSRTQTRDLRGRFRARLTREECSVAVDRAQQYVGELTDRLQRHLSDFEVGRIPSSEWEHRCAVDIAHYYELQFQCGSQAVGDPGLVLRPDQKAALSRLIRDELDYLAGFRADMDAGRGKLPYAERMRMYSLASREPFWVAFVMSDTRKLRRLRWEYGDTEHCDDCQRFNDLGWMSVVDFMAQIISKGYAPQSGHLACLGSRCKCSIRESLNGVDQPGVAL